MWHNNTPKPVELTQNIWLSFQYQPWRAQTKHSSTLTHNWRMRNLLAWVQYALSILRCKMKYIHCIMWTAVQWKFKHCQQMYKCMKMLSMPPAYRSTGFYGIMLTNKRIIFIPQCWLQWIVKMNWNQIYLNPLIPF